MFETQDPERILKKLESVKRISKRKIEMHF